MRDATMKVLAKQLIGMVMSDKKAQSDPAFRRCMDLFQNLDKDTFNLALVDGSSTIRFSFRTKDGVVHKGTLT